MMCDVGAVRVKMMTSPDIDGRNTPILGIGP